ncbi:MAG: hypothetical protein HC810_07545 [Acaryochloridaceae cyanobacterium RL_2_7]|nr:hypothetical protein [Acaryochloridaceae cyanobacterium RL_2_7]
MRPDYNVTTHQLKLVRSNLFAAVNYTGDGNGKLFVTKRFSSTSDHGGIRYYTIVLTAILETAMIPFPLETFDISEDKIQDAIEKWQNRLQLIP